jgi:hypothetical protein
VSKEAYFTTLVGVAIRTPQVGSTPASGPAISS